MEALNLSNIFRSRPFLDGLYFCRVNMDPIPISAFLFICKKTIYPKDGEDKPQMVYELMQALATDQNVIKVENHKLSYTLSKNVIH